MNEQSTTKKCITLRMERQHLLTPANETEYDPLQYLLIDGTFHGAVVGHFRNGLYDLNDVRIDDASLLSRKDEILAAVQTANFGARPQRFMGEKL